MVVVVVILLLSVVLVFVLVYPHLIFFLHKIKYAKFVSVFL